jgi:hypothetical protein
MKFWFYSLIILLITSCTDKDMQNDISEIKIQNYSFDFPKGYKKVKQKTFNSYVGQISNDTITFDFHFSNHVLPPVISVTQFFDHKEWEPGVLLYIATKKHIIGGIIFSTPRKATEKDSTIGNGCDYIVKCKSDSLEFEAPIYLPGKMRGMTISADTVFGQYRETYISNDPEKGITGVFIKPIPKNGEVNSEKDALSLTTTNLTGSQQKEVLRIVSSFRLTKSD